MQEAEDGESHSAGGLVCVEEEEGMASFEVNVPRPSRLPRMHVPGLTAHNEYGIVLLVTELEPSEVLNHAVHRLFEVECGILAARQQTQVRHLAEGG